MLTGDIKDYGGSPELINALSGAGVKTLFPPQEAALRSGLLSSEDSFVIAAPTASGKTLIAEMAALKAFFGGSGKTIYLVPLRALAREKFEDFKAKYGAIGLKTMQSTGDYDRTEPWLHEADIIVTTNEKLDSLIRHRAPWLYDVGLVVADEVHLLGDGHRGPTLEVVLTRLMAMKSGLRLLALSATIPNAGEIAEWLGARLIESDWRPVPLREGVFFNGIGTFNDGTERRVRPESDSDAVNLALDTIKEGGQVLVFVNTRKATEAVARSAGPHVSETVGEKDLAYLKKLSDDVIASTAEPTHQCRKLAETVMNGVAFHHAGINYSQRKLVEDAFRANKLKLIVATTTLAMGLNLPSRRVVVRDWMRYESGVGQRPVPAIEIKQMSGRAGRPGFDDYGEALIVARSEQDKRRLFDRYIEGRPEKIESQLASEPALRTHILSSIAGAFTGTELELREFLERTLSARQRGAYYLHRVAGEIMDFLRTEGMVSVARGRLDATPFGRRVSELYIDPLTAVIIRDGLRHPAEKETFPLLHMIARLPDMMRVSSRKKDYEEMLDVFHAHAAGLLIPEEERYPTEDVLSELKTASALMQWILESHEDKITSHFGIGPGDLRTLVDLADWLLYSTGELSKVFGLRGEMKAVSNLRARVSYGVKEELLPLVSLRGIGRVRARNLHDAGFKTLADIGRAGAEELSGVPAMGSAIALDIKKQVENRRGS